MSRGPHITAAEIAIIHAMRSQGSRYSEIASRVNRSDTTVRRCCLAGPLDAVKTDALHRRWAYLMPAMREAMRKAGAQP